MAGHCAVPSIRRVFHEHARRRLAQRKLEATEIEQAIRDGHAERNVNDGRAAWIVSGVLSDGTAFEAIYDHPHGDDETAVRIVSAWSSIRSRWAALPLRTMFAYYDRDADIAWFPTGESHDLAGDGQGRQVSTSSTSRRR
ncbi:MAG TPA: DUF4258 domain-containing protein [Solirubrobacterales bacterium]|nr:DUF4258 domain-containing protein [Solirubrobacterales bacterium]